MKQQNILFIILVFALLVSVFYFIKLAKATEFIDEDEETASDYNEQLEQALQQQEREEQERQDEEQARREEQERVGAREALFPNEEPKDRKVKYRGTITKNGRPGGGYGPYNIYRDQNGNEVIVVNTGRGRVVFDNLLAAVNFVEGDSTGGEGAYPPVPSAIITNPSASTNNLIVRADGTASYVNRRGEVSTNAFGKFIAKALSPITFLGEYVLYPAAELRSYPTTFLATKIAGLIDSDIKTPSLFDAMFPLIAEERAELAKLRAEMEGSFDEMLTLSENELAVTGANTFINRYGDFAIDFVNINNEIPITDVIDYISPEALTGSDYIADVYPQRSSPIPDSQISNFIVSSYFGNDYSSIIRDATEYRFSLNPQNEQRFYNEAQGLTLSAQLPQIVTSRQVIDGLNEKIEYFENFEPDAPELQDLRVQRDAAEYGDLWANVNFKLKFNEIDIDEALDLTSDYFDIPRTEISQRAVMRLKGDLDVIDANSNPIPEESQNALASAAANYYGALGGEGDYLTTENVVSDIPAAFKLAGVRQLQSDTNGASEIYQLILKFAEGKISSDDQTAVYYQSLASEAALGIALNNLQKNNVGTSLVFIDKALEVNPFSQRAIELKNNIQKGSVIAGLDAISSGMGESQNANVRILNNYLGEDSPIMSSIQRALEDIAGFDGVTFGDLREQAGTALDQLVNSQNTQLSQQKTGIGFIKGLVREGYTLEQIRTIANTDVESLKGLLKNSFPDLFGCDGCNSNRESQIAYYIRQVFTNSDLARLTLLGNEKAHNFFDSFAGDYSSLEAQAVVDNINIGRTIWNPGNVIGAVMGGFAATRIISSSLATSGFSITLTNGLNDLMLAEGFATGFAGQQGIVFAGEALAEIASLGGSSMESANDLRGISELASMTFMFTPLTARIINARAGNTMLLTREGAYNGIRANDAAELATIKNNYIEGGFRVASERPGYVVLDDPTGFDRMTRVIFEGNAPTSVVDVNARGESVSRNIVASMPERTFLNLERAGVARELSEHPQSIAPKELELFNAEGFVERALSSAREAVTIVDRVRALEFIVDAESNYYRVNLERGATRGFGEADPVVNARLEEINSAIRNIYNRLSNEGLSEIQMSELRSLVESRATRGISNTFDTYRVGRDWGDLADTIATQGDSFDGAILPTGDGSRIRFEIIPEGSASGTKIIGGKTISWDSNKIYVDGIEKSSLAGAYFKGSGGSHYIVLNMREIRGLSTRSEIPFRNVIEKIANHEHVEYLLANTYADRLPIYIYELFTKPDAEFRVLLNSLGESFNLATPEGRTGAANEILARAYDTGYAEFHDLYADPLNIIDASLLRMVRDRVAELDISISFNTLRGIEMSGDIVPLENAAYFSGVGLETRTALRDVISYLKESPASESSKTAEFQAKYELYKTSAQGRGYEIPDVPLEVFFSRQYLANKFIEMSDALKSDTKADFDKTNFEFSTSLEGLKLFLKNREYNAFETARNKLGNYFQEQQLGENIVGDGPPHEVGYWIGKAREQFNYEVDAPIKAYLDNVFDRGVGEGTPLTFEDVLESKGLTMDTKVETLATEGIIKTQDLPTFITDFFDFSIAELHEIVKANNEQEVRAIFNGKVNEILLILEESITLKTRALIILNRVYLPEGLKPGDIISREAFEIQVEILNGEVEFRQQVFRFDERMPEEVLSAGGFKPNPNKEIGGLFEHFMAGRSGTGDFVSTTKIKENDLLTSRGRYEYRIRNVEGYNVNNLLNVRGFGDFNRALVMNEREFVIREALPEQIDYLKNGEWTPLTSLQNLINLRQSVTEVLQIPNNGRSGIGEQVSAQTIVTGCPIAAGPCGGVGTRTNVPTSVTLNKEARAKLNIAKQLILENIQGRNYPTSPNLQTGMADGWVIAKNLDIAGKGNTDLRLVFYQGGEPEGLIHIRDGHIDPISVKGDSSVFIKMSGDQIIAMSEIEVKILLDHALRNGRVTSARMTGSQDGYNQLKIIVKYNNYEIKYVFSNFEPGGTDYFITTAFLESNPFPNKISRDRWDDLTSGRHTFYPETRFISF